MGWHVTLRIGKFLARILLMRSVKLWDPTSIWNFNPRNFNTTTNLQSRLPSGRTWNSVVINIGWFRLRLCQWPKVGLRAAKWLIKKKFEQIFCYFKCRYPCTITMQPIRQLPQQTQDVNWTSWTSSKRLMYAQFTSCV